MAAATAAAWGDGGKACGEMKDAANLGGAAFYLWIWERLNFWRREEVEGGGRRWKEARGLSVTLEMSPGVNGDSLPVRPLICRLASVANVS